MLIIATFIGQDGSCGYSTGKTYHLCLRGSEIERMDCTGRVPYGTVQAFLENWQVEGSY